MRPLGQGVERRCSHTVVGGDADYLDGVDVVGAQPVEQRPAIRIGDALEAGVRGGVLALVENQLEIGSIEIGVQLRA